MSDPNEPPWWLNYILPILAFFRNEIIRCYTEMKTWSRVKLKEFWGHAMAVITGITGIGLASYVFYHNQVDFMTVFLGLFNNFEQSYVPVVIYSILMVGGVLGSWLVYSDTKCCIKVIKTGDCV